MVLSMMVVALWAQTPGCAKDTDCKGERICEAGVCVAPAAVQPSAHPEPSVHPERSRGTPPPPPPPAEASSYPRVVRREGAVCVQTLEADGRVTESCRAEEPAPSSRVRTAPAHASTYAAEPEPPPAKVVESSSRFVASVLLHGGLLAGAAGGSTVTLPQLGGSLALGARFRSGVGVGGLFNLSVGVAPGFAMFFASLTPALRFGDRSHFLLGFGPTVIAYSVAGGGGGSGLAASLLAAGVFAVGEAFALNLHSALHVDASGVVFTLGAGIGFGAF